MHFKENFQNSFCDGYSLANFSFDKKDFGKSHKNDDFRPISRRGVGYYTTYGSKITNFRLILFEIQLWFCKPFIS
jgi:hypothetical protein